MERLNKKKLMKGGSKRNPKIIIDPEKEKAKEDAEDLRRRQEEKEEDRRQHLRYQQAEEIERRSRIQEERERRERVRREQEIRERLRREQREREERQRRAQERRERAQRERERMRREQEERARGPREERERLRTEARARREREERERRELVRGVLTHSGLDEIVSDYTMSPREREERERMRQVRGIYPPGIAEIVSDYTTPPLQDISNIIGFDLTSDRTLTQEQADTLTNFLINNPHYILYTDVFRYVHSDRFMPRTNGARDNYMFVFHILNDTQIRPRTREWARDQTTWLHIRQMFPDLNPNSEVVRNLINSLPEE